MASARRCSSRGARVAPTDRFSSARTSSSSSTRSSTAGRRPREHRAGGLVADLVDADPLVDGAVGRAVALRLLAGRGHDLPPGRRGAGAALLEPAGRPAGQAAPLGIARPWAVPPACGPTRRRDERRLLAGAAAGTARLPATAAQLGADRAAATTRRADELPDATAGPTAAGPAPEPEPRELGTGRLLERRELEPAAPRAGARAASRAPAAGAARRRTVAGRGHGRERTGPGNRAENEERGPEGPRSRRNPAASYSPRESPPKYHRRWWA